MKDELTSEEKLTLGKLVQSFQTWKANHERHNDASSHRPAPRT